MGGEEAGEPTRTQKGPRPRDRTQNICAFSLCASPDGLALRYSSTPTLKSRSHHTLKGSSSHCLHLSWLSSGDFLMHDAHGYQHEYTGERSSDKSECDRHEIYQYFLSILATICRDVETAEAISVIWSKPKPVLTIIVLCQ